MEYLGGIFTMTDTFRIQVSNPYNSRKCTVIFINTNIQVSTGVKEMYEPCFQSYNSLSKSIMYMYKNMATIKMIKYKTSSRKYFCTRP